MYNIYNYPYNYLILKFYVILSYREYVLQKVI